MYQGPSPADRVFPGYERPLRQLDTEIAGLVVHDFPVHTPTFEQLSTASPKTALDITMNAVRQLNPRLNDQPY